MTTLDYIPGSNFLGIAARHLYGRPSESGKLTQEEAFQVFHSGEVIFGDGRIATSLNEITYAVPFSFFSR
ncbi:hypothetical protein ADICYQ_1249 [Cyclobacterium qasimii M12-11B]|uniref:Uncharacterized protein n=2 Tax=Cyclobacterium qasimii TaxID=1350429 RepID=S7X101_9BACT|nr:hypothetical protein ADICYQ_1249 [Cyclobacterium qasimii M12-11B]